jgi:prolyl 4-hydroxylase
VPRVVWYVLNQGKDYDYDCYHRHYYIHDDLDLFEKNMILLTPNVHLLLYNGVSCSFFHTRCFRSTTFPIGASQEIHPDDVDDDAAIQNTINVIIETFAYMEKVMTERKYTSVRVSCQNTDEYCSALAADGACIQPVQYDEENDENNNLDDEEVQLYQYMIEECAPACQLCDQLISHEEAMIVEGCVPDIQSNIFGPGDLNKMFERIVGELSDDGQEGQNDMNSIIPREDIQILSRPGHPHDFEGNDNDPTDYVIGPWIITIDNFLTSQECDRLVKLGAKLGYERSTLEEEKDYSEEELAEEREGEDAYRTSTNTWCENDCYKDRTTQQVIKKLEDITGIPDTYSEHLQLLSYVPGQYYKEHHDWLDDAPYRTTGPRILTFFLYLNDVEEGGATRFTDLTGDDGGISIDVQPKKGRALIWPSISNHDPLDQDNRTYHEALTLEKGKKFGANAWFHLRDYKNDKCDDDAFNAIGSADEEDEHEADTPSQSDEL